MMTLTESSLRSYANAQSFERGHEYYRSGAIYNAVRQGNILLADCLGSVIYHLRIELDESGIQSAFCSCPYDFGGYCKHLVALLLTYIHNPDEFDERVPLSTLLENVEKAALITLLTKLADRQPELYDWIETSLPVSAAAVTSAASRPKQASQVSENAWRKRIKNVFRSAGDYYDDYNSSYVISNDLDEMIKSATEILSAGDAQGASTILLALLDEFSDAYEMLDDSDGDLSSSIEYAAEILAEAILSADLSEEERAALQNKLDPIAEELSDYGMNDESLEIAQLALEYGWETLSEDDDDFTYDLNAAKLNVLERQGRVDEFLALCQQTGEWLRYAQKLLQLDRVEAAIQTAYRFEMTDEVLEISKALREADRLSDAIALAEHGLTLTGVKHGLAIWLAPLEEAQGRPEQALQAYLLAFEEFPNLEIYKHLQRLAGEHWAQMKPAQMKILLASGRPDTIVNVYLYEKQWDEAIAIVEKNAYDDGLCEKVVEAVIAHRPDWVIRISISKADKLIGLTHSKSYPQAVRWLEKAKRAYLQAGREAEWRDYFTNLKTIYARRPALQREMTRL